MKTGNIYIFCHSIFLNTSNNYTAIHNNLNHFKQHMCYKIQYSQFELTQQLIYLLSWIKVKNIDTKQSNKRKNKASQSKRQVYHMKLGDTNDRTTGTSMKTGGEIRCSRRVSIPGTPNSNPAPVMITINIVLR